MLIKLIRKLYNAPFRLLELICLRLPYFKFVLETHNTQTPINFNMWFRQEIRGINRGPYWPVHPSSMVTGWRNIIIGVETSPGMMPGCYIQGIGKIYIGDYTQIAPNVGIISANHAKEDLRKHEPLEVNIGNYCWLGMGSKVLPGVTLGDFTVVGAGAVVTRSFPEGCCVIGGNPAKQIRKIARDSCSEPRSEYEYCGFIPKQEFDSFRKRNLNV